MFDSIADPTTATEIRDGVCLDPASGLAAANLKYDLEVAPANTRFPLRFELEVPEDETEGKLLALLWQCLSGLEDGSIRLGARRTRGLGACKTSAWRGWRWNLSGSPGWSDYLRQDPAAPIPLDVQAQPTALAALRAAGAKDLTAPAARSWPRLELELFSRSVFIREPGLQNGDPDSIQFRSGGREVIPGSSLAGALRARARRVAYLMRPDLGDGLIEYMFGSGGSGGPRSSRLRVSEPALTSPGSGGAAPKVTRVRIDRFTGGAADGVLFEERPASDCKWRAELELRCGETESETARAALGLLLLCAKDLISGDLPVGGTSSVGRGTATGTARLFLDGKVIELRPGAPAPTEVVSAIERLRDFVPSWGQQHE